MTQERVPPCRAAVPQWQHPNLCCRSILTSSTLSPWCGTRERSFYLQPMPWPMPLWSTQIQRLKDPLISTFNCQVCCRQVAKNIRQLRKCVDSRPGLNSLQTMRDVAKLRYKPGTSLDGTMQPSCFSTNSWPSEAFGGGWFHKCLRKSAAGPLKCMHWKREMQSPQTDRSYTLPAILSQGSWADKNPNLDHTIARLQLQRSVLQSCAQLHWWDSSWMFGAWFALPKKKVWASLNLNGVSFMSEAPLSRTPNSASCFAEEMDHRFHLESSQVDYAWNRFVGSPSSILSVISYHVTSLQRSGSFSCAKEVNQQKTISQSQAMCRIQLHQPQGMKPRPSKKKLPFPDWKFGFWKKYISGIYKTCHILKLHLSLHCRRDMWYEWMIPWSFDGQKQHCWELQFSTIWDKQTAIRKW